MTLQFTRLFAAESDEEPSGRNEQNTLFNFVTLMNSRVFLFSTPLHLKRPLTLPHFCTRLNMVNLKRNHSFGREVFFSFFSKGTLKGTKMNLLVVLVALYFSYAAFILDFFLQLNKSFRKSTT